MALMEVHFHHTLAPVMVFALPLLAKMAPMTLPAVPKQNVVALVESPRVQLLSKRCPLLPYPSKQSFTVYRLLRSQRFLTIDLEVHTKKGCNLSQWPNKQREGLARDCPGSRWLSNQNEEITQPNRTSGF